MNAFEILILMSSPLFLLVMAIIFPTKLVQSVEVLLAEIAKWTRQELRDICQLGGVVDEDVLLTKNGSLISAIEIKGSLGIIGDEEFNRMLDKLRDVNNAQLRGAVSFEWVYEQELNIENRLKPAIKSMQASASRIGMELSDVLDGEAAAITSKAHDEKTYLLITSRPTQKGKEASEEYLAAKKKAGLEAIRFDDSIALPILEIGLDNAHESIVTSVMSSLHSSKMLFNRMTVESILKIVKESMDSSFFGDFKPYLPTSGSKPLAVGDDKNFSPYPPIWRQICSNNIERTSHISMVKIKDMYYACAWIEIPPQSEKSFKVLLSSLKGISFRISFKLAPEGLKLKSFDKTLVSFLAIFKKSRNKKIKEAYDMIEDMRASGDSDLGVSISFCTWSKNQADCAAQLSELSAKIRSWGVCDVQNDCGDSVELFLSTVPAFTNINPAKLMPLPTSVLTTMLPVFSPASAWGLDSGGVLFTDIDNKVLPFAVGSSAQKGWVYLIYSQIGSGKSVILNTLELGTILRAGQGRLPMMVVIDVGESVLGLVGMVQDSLPQKRQSEAIYVKLQMRNEYAVNMLDTQLGYRRPLSAEREMMVNFLSLLVTPAGRTKPYDSVYELAGMVIDEAFDTFSEEKTPKKYEPNVDFKIDKAIADAGFMIDGSTTWWEVTDALFEVGYAYEASLAQRYAVPLLTDLTRVLNNQQIQDLFKTVKVAETGEKLTDFVGRMISTSLNDYPIFSRPTVFDVGSSRVIGIDLGAVRGANSDAGKKQTALMYLFSQALATKSFYLDDDMLIDIPVHCPELYSKFHVGRIKEAKEELKVIAYDEFHNTGGIESVRRAVGLNIREGRKYSIMVCLASQLIDDFDEDMVENASGVFMMSADSPIGVEKTRKLFALSESEVGALTRYVTTVGVFMGIFNTKEGRTVHVMKNILSPQKYWAFTTTAEDKAIKKYIGLKIGVTQTRILLAKHYPYGIKKDLERMKFENSEDGINSAVQNVADKLLAIK